jgi:hypothetical protein
VRNAWPPFSTTVENKIMKKLKSWFKVLVLFLMLLTLCLWASVAKAQTNTAPPIPTTGAAKTVSVLEDMKHLGGDAWAALKDANFHNGITVEPFGIYHAGDFGGGLALSTASTNGVNVGFAVAAINDSASKRFDFYDATLNIQLGRQVTIPVINIPAFLYIEAGPAVNLRHPNTILEQSIAGAKIFFDKGKISVGAGIGQNSEWTEPFYVAHFSYTF